MSEIVSGVASALLANLTTKAYHKIVWVCGLKREVERLKKSVKLVSAFLSDAENKQFKDQSIALWLKELKHALYDAVDILDEIECQENISKAMKIHGGVSQKVCQFFSASNPLVFHVNMAHKIKEIREKIDEIARERNNLGLIQNSTNDMAPNKMLSWRETHSSLPSRITGRDEEKELIISLLMSEPSQSQSKNVTVIPIVAMGGCGKTTLAQFVFNDSRIADHYDLKLWVHVSQDFDVKRIISKIVTQEDDTKGRGGEGMTLERLKTLLHEKLYDKKFLLVLDDMWNENAKRWHDLRDLLLDTIGERNKNDCKIIVTTRSDRVADIVKTVTKIKLQVLPEEECLQLFFKCAFQEEGEANQRPRLQEIGKEIVAKCKGLPLAIVTLGCILRSQEDENEWKRIRDSEIWEIDHQKDDEILPALRLSYSQLPSPLKQCFSYCALFPKGHEYMPIELIPIWMAHGVLRPTNENEDPECLGELHFRQLISLSFFQFVDQFRSPFEDELPFDYDVGKVLGIGSYIMHDLIHDLAMSTMHGETTVISSASTHVNEKVRHISISTNPDQLPLLALKKNKVQSFVNWHTQGDITTTEPFVKWISKEFKYLRVLDLQNLAFQFLPDFFDKMKHLRYLNLSCCSQLKKLPKSISKLYNLQTLILQGCVALEELPKNLRNLINLRFFMITAQITNLCFVDIRFFSYLQILTIFSCHNLEVMPCDLSHLVSLKKLVIMGCEKLVRFEDEVENEGRGKQNEVAKEMNLQRFAIAGSPKLINLPNWLQRSAKTLQQICIWDTSLTALPEWLPNATSLNSLYILDCEELLSLPENMDHCRSLQTLGIIGCPDLSKRYKGGVGPEWSKIAHVPNVYVSFC
ncbi:putative disease resistance protein RGA4 [Abrus precatorius]|uniref:Disease resistance protein RGA4 n=1 Tax=Abrus precatorius TaxID=3816 RepID=A0A8B8L4H6_ABRPR|nr:putative disease resistance protein RGA4 [Abrus precatorius]